MEAFTRFLYDVLTQFFSGVLTIITSIGKGFSQMFDISTYKDIMSSYSSDLSTPEWVLTVISVVIVIIICFIFAFFIFLILKKYLKFRKEAIEQEVLLEELSDLNNRVSTLIKEKNEILAMKVSQIGLKPGESNLVEINEKDENNEEDKKLVGDQRFSKLAQIDEEYKGYKIKDYSNNFTLPELCEDFRNFAASKLGLYYTDKMMKLFVAALSSTKLVILQGISGTGKTSLAYAWGKFLKHDSCVASVQPSWRDRTELFGYFNEFTKKFNETDTLKEMYKAGFTDDIYTVILDEMNISRVEYYFAEMLSILEMPNKDEWVIELVPNSWKTDPQKLKGGKLRIPANMWYIGTINNDDSTFMVTDKVYDRAMPIDINDKGQVFEPVDTPSMNINYSYLDKLFDNAMNENQVSQETLDKIEEMDNYVIQHFRIAFGNRIVAHMKKFVPVYVACGGDEIEGVDYFIAKKILRKFEQLNISYIRDELDPYMDFLNKTFGKNRMKECIEFITRLKKLT
jgi:large-conductance mechanosensitive channel